MRLKSILREPLLHFIAIGAALFVWFQWGSGGAGPGSTRIAITSGQIEHLAASYTKAWQRPPTDAELKGLVDDWVREEIAVREAVAAGLDRDDTIIRRRLRQKFEFLAEDASQAAPPTEQELEAWLAAHADAFRVEPRVAFRQIFVSRERRGAAAESDAAAILARLNAIGPGAATNTSGDPTMLPPEVDLTSLRDVDRLFGPGFAQRIEDFAPGVWAGPVKSGYGLHLVLVRERIAGSLPKLAAVRPLVERELLAERRKRQLDAIYEQLLAKYKVVIEPRAPAAAASGLPGGGS
ncbi:MAG TPA: peptidylprolyl isomerase [Burkholderiaceae bacterium]|nr:peptidylprolyl isomerase [Burkholderiaceae bacterium]